MIVEVKASFGSKKKTATGYPIAPNRIITARHTFYRDNSEVSEEVKVRWYHKKNFRNMIGVRQRLLIVDLIQN